MSGIIEKLVQNRDVSEAKSYIIGLERGRTWAEDCADYFEIRMLSELKDEEFALPQPEDIHLKAICSRTPIEISSYLKGWRDGVKEIRRQY